MSDVAEQEASGGLQGQLVAVPESRQLDVLEDLLRNRGAQVMRVPLIAILDAPDSAPILRWLREFIANPPDYFIILTGEGLRRLLGFAQREGIEASFREALAGVCRICRGPKPGRALKEIDLKPDVLGKAPTTAGIIETLAELPIEQKRVAVQLYGEEPNLPLMEYLQARRALALPVAPYIYAPRSDEERVLELIEALATGQITMMTFTSQPQYARLQSVARAHGLEERLASGLARVHVAAVGPVVAEQLRQAGVSVAVMPESLFFMKPMVTELVRLARGGTSVL
ncbi:MAG: uroporphyrinogen-III synthase [Pseudomonadales bacterium]|nr:uroporphyrinogen-III synthase [Pseudomonadales bacterium]